ncbi:glycerol-3-phosphate dehydrogenase [Herminiimonas sp. KBW02]|uniref:glycerol-3-phosphate dehydrogenase n=1 Tax=Herminiimonas sp. KBW02 TaxID=2153363 RepID=UPI000F5AD88A|nr:glycerol-3-phosphate dehydrogenase [Herminiimonas sp. KBW02]RQO37109.1 glycerol-3-phosphate dehydrogenase [Herminiimonas sp. KBW02]
MQQALQCDILIVGGGINGAGIARDAAGRGLSVVLCEKDDLAAHTSSASTKLIHGGLRYLENYEFGLVRKALIEREILLRSAPHIMHPLRFVMPHDKGQRPAWMIRAGLFLYDHLAKRELLPGSCGINLRTHTAGSPLKEEFSKGFVYSDGWVNDARLVVLNAIAAAEQGAHILTRTACVAVTRQADKWQATLRSKDNAEIQVQAKLLVNAAGPWAASFLHDTVHGRSGKKLRLIKGSHIVVKKLFDHPYAYIFQHPDGRIVFAIPYEQDFTLIGTTDIDYHGDTDHVAIDASEIAYLCELSNYYFRQTISPSDVVWSYSGVRPLVEDVSDDDNEKASAVTRDYKLAIDTDAAPVLTIFGGKITTFRKLAEEAVDLIAPLLNNRHGAWTTDALLPGGDIYGAQANKRAVLEFDEYVHELQQEYAWLPAALVERYARAYGTRIKLLLENRNSIADMGEEIAPGLFAAEVAYLTQYEWATSTEDILWRRTKLGLHLTQGNAARSSLNHWFQELDKQ